MLNLNDLEERWLQYKIKSYIPHAVIVISLIIILLIVLLFDFSSSDENTDDKTVLLKETIVEENAKKTNSIEESNENKVHKTNKLNTTYEASKDKKMLISPSLNFMREINHNSPQYYNTKEDEKDTSYHQTAQVKQKVIEEEEEVVVVKNDIVIEVEEPEVEIVKESIINIKRQNTQDDIGHVIERFKRSNNHALSLFIAKKYYEAENYNQAYNYSLITNELNKDIEESWLIFAKSLVKLKQKDKAIKILSRYISQSRSDKATILLDNIKSGKFR